MLFLNPAMTIMKALPVWFWHIYWRILEAVGAAVGRSTFKGAKRVQQSVRTTVVERAPCRRQDRRVAHQLLQKSQGALVHLDSSIATPSHTSYLLCVVHPGN